MNKSARRAPGSVLCETKGQLLVDGESLTAPGGQQSAISC